MSYNKKFEKIREVIEKSLEQGKEVIPLYENKFNDTKQYCEIREFTAFVDKVQQSYRNEKMSELTLIFNNGEKATTHVFLDDINLREKSIVSVIGYVNKYNGDYQLYCRGITPIYTCIEDLVKLNVDLNKFVKISLAINLSNIEETKVFTENDKIIRIEGTEFFYIEKPNPNSTDKMDLLKQFLENMHSKEQDEEKEHTKEEIVKENNTTENIINDVLKDII